MSMTKTRRHLYFAGLTVTVLAVFLTQHFSAPQPSVEPKIERPDRARKPRVFANQGLPATTLPVDLPVARTTAPVTQPNPAPIQLTREEISTALVAFKKWAEVFVVTSADKKPELVGKGLVLAEARGQAVAALIKQDPLAAIQSLLPYPLRKSLPPEIAAKIEHRVSGEGDLMVVAVNPLPGAVVAEPIYRTAKLAEKKYRAYVYGSRKNDVSRTKTRILGVGVKPATAEALLAVREDAYEVLDPTEAADLDPNREPTVCPVSKNPTVSNKDETAVDTGKKIVWLCSGGHLSEWLTTPEGKIVAAAGGSGSSSGTSPVMPATWTQGHKKFIAMRVRFADQPVGFEPASDATMQTELQKVVDKLPLWSYGKMTASFVFTPTFNLPGTKESYASGGMDLIGITRAIADAYTDASGGHPYESTNFDFDTVFYNADWGDYAGVAWLGIKGTMIKFAGAGLMLHEWGHNFGLVHANFWEPITDSPIGAGIHGEYGNGFSTMGSSSEIGSYNTQERFLLQWLQPTNIPSVTTSNTYRIYNADNPILTSGRSYTLKLDKSDATYFVEYRPNCILNKTTFATDNGAMILWQQNYEMLDMTPFSSAKYADASLLVGHSFHDSKHEITVTPVARGGNAPNDYLDVVVNFNSPITNSPPVALVTTSTYTPEINSSVNLKAYATDPDGDALAYAWDFGDGGNRSVDNSSNQTKSWSKAGNYNVRCTVSDMKGKTFVQSLLIRVGTPSTFTISGRVTQPDGTPVQNVLVKDAISQTTYTDASGRYTLGPLRGGNYKMAAFCEGWQLSLPSAIPLSVTSSVTNFNFIATQTSASQAITLEHWSNINGSTLSSLTSHPNYPSTPTYSRLVGDLFETPSNTEDNYGQRMRGYFVAPTTGAYTFYIASDDQSQLYLSTTNLVADKKLIASVNGYTAPRNWTVSASQKSAAISLTAGQHYYIEALHKEGGGGDNLAVGVDFPDGTQHRPIQTTYLRPMSGSVIPSQIPENTVTLAVTDPLAKENPTDTGTFTVTRSGSLTSALEVFFGITGTATYTTDYLPTGLSVVIPAGSSSATIPINPVDDALSELNETITLQLAPAVTYNLGLVSKGTVTIQDNELPMVSVIATQPIMTESGEETATFTFVRTGNPAMAISANFATSGTAIKGIDYPNLPTTVTIPAGQTSTNVTITATADATAETEETVILSLLPGSGYLTTSPLTATGYILAQPSSISWKLAENGDWSDSSKWLTDRPIAGGSLSYALDFNTTGSSYSSQNNLGDNFRLNQLNFGGDTVSLTGDSLRWVANRSGNPILNQNNENTLSISNDLILTTTFTVGGSGNGDVRLTGFISGEGNLNKTHSGRLSLSAESSYTGGTTIRRGSIDISVPQRNALGTGLITLESGTTLNLNRNIMENQLVLKAATLASTNGYGDQWLGHINLTDVSMIDLSNTGVFTISGNINGGGGLNKIGTSSRALTLSGISTYKGPTIISEGILACSRPESLAQGTLRINSGAKLELNFDTTRQVSALQLNSDTFQPTGIYGSVASGATYQNDTYFSGPGTITVGPLSATPFASWATAQGLSGASNNTPMADPDHDGICNLLEFTLGSNPIAASAAAVPQLKIDNYGLMTFEFDRSDASLSSVTGVLEYGNDLIGWTIIPIPLTSSTQVTITDGPLKDHVVVNVPNNGDHVFVRLRVSQ
jgi:autotransporter-associated beta strand protein